MTKAPTATQARTNTVPTFAMNRMGVAAKGATPASHVDAAPLRPLLRTEIGDVLRDIRTNQGRTLRDVSSAAQVSLGYLSEVERGQKEASSELLEAICDALNVPLWAVLHEVSERLAVADGALVSTGMAGEPAPVALMS